MDMKITGNGAGKQLIFVEKLTPKVKRTTTVPLDAETIQRLYSILTSKTVIEPPLTQSKVILVTDHNFQD